MSVKKELNQDLWIVGMTSLAALSIWIIFNSQIISFVNNNSIHILFRVLLTAMFQFSIAGLGITIVSFLRKESFRSYGLNKDKILITILLSMLCFLPELIFRFITGDLTSYQPFQGVKTTREVLASGFPTNIIGMLMIGTAWGFFEGFNYVVMSDKINGLYPSENKWINWGAISCSILCVGIHGAVGITPSAITEMLSTIFLIYGMLIVKARTGNAWGCIFIFVFLWNAF